MNKQVNYTKVGAFVLGLVALLVVIVIWLSGRQDHNGYNTYLIRAKTDVSGLRENSVVRFNGVKVGSVAKIKIDTQDPRVVLLTVDIANHIPITTATVATLKNEGITGIQYVSLKVKQSDSATLLVSKKGQLAVIAFEPSMFSKISDSVSGIMANVTKVTQKMTAVLSQVEQLMPDLQHALHHWGDVGEHLADATDQMRQDPSVLLWGSEKTGHGPGES